MPEIVVYTKDWCSYCRAARAQLQQLGLAFTEIDVTDDPVRFQEMLARANGRTTVPQIFIDGLGIGGYTDLVALVRRGGLAPAPSH